MGYYEDGLREARNELNQDLAKLGEVHPNYLAAREDMLGRSALFNASLNAGRAGDQKTADDYTNQWRREMDGNIRKRFGESGSTHLLDESIMHTNPDGSLKPGSVAGGGGGMGGGGTLVKQGNGGNMMRRIQQVGQGAGGAAGAARNFLGNAAKIGVPAAIGLGGLALGAGAAAGISNMMKGNEESPYAGYDDEFQLTPYQQQLAELNAQAREDADLQGDVFERSSRLQRELGKDTLEQKMYKELAIQGQLNKAQEAQNVLNQASDRMRTIGGTIQAAAGNQWY